MEDSQITGGLGGAASGAATGAMVGSIVPGIGTVIGAGIGAVVGGISGILSGGGEEEAQKLAQEQAKMIEMQAREEQRKKIIQVNTQVGLTKAATYASNLQDSGSAKKFRSMMETEYRRELAYDRLMTKKQVEYTLEGGQVAADSIKRAGVGSMFDGFTKLGAAAAGGAFDKSDTGLFGEGKTTKVYSGNF